MWIFAIVQKQPPLINWNFLFRKYVFDVLNWATSKILVRLIHILSSLCTSFLCKCHWSHFCAVLWQPHSTHYYNQWWFNLWNHSIFLPFFFPPLLVRHAIDQTHSLGWHVLRLTPVCFFVVFKWIMLKTDSSCLQQITLKGRVVEPCGQSFLSWAAVFSSEGLLSS